MRHTALPLCLLVFLVACAGGPPAAAAPTAVQATASAFPARPGDTPLPTLTLAPGVSPTPAASATPEESGRTHYDLRLLLDYAGHSAHVDETITYTNRTGEPLAELLLAAEPRLWAGAFTLKRFGLDGQPSGPEIDGQRVLVKLAAPLAPGASIRIGFEYSLQLPLKNARYQFGYNARQASLLDWYPFIVPYVPGQGWLLHNPALVGEHLVYESADFDVRVRLADPAGSVILAAAAPGTPEGDWTHYRLRGARGFALSASDRFQVSTAQAAGVEVTSYYFDGHQAAGTQAAAVTAEAVRFFSETFGPYPYESLAVVESSSEDGMESDGLFFLGAGFYDSYDGSSQNYLTTLSVHETAHQWWYGLVGNDQALEPWLDEALATYSERLFYESRHPEQVDWWWQFRVRRFNPVGSVNRTIYDYPAFRPYTDATYFVGAYWLEDLRVRVGAETFRAAIRDYAQSNARGIAASGGFFAVLERHTGVDYADILKEYFK